MKNKICDKYTKYRFPILILLVSGLLLTACGQKEPASESVAPATDFASDSDSGAAKPSETAESNIGTDDASQAESETEDEETESEASKKDENGQTGGGAAESRTAAARQTDVQDNIPGNASAGANAAPVSADSELNGYIEVLGDHTFTVNKIFTEEGDDGSMVAYSSNEEKTLINVIYTDETAFIICTSKDQGITSANAAGTSADLKQDKLVLIKGSWSGDVFCAAEVTIYHFE